MKKIVYKFYLKIIFSYIFYISINFHTFVLAEDKNDRINVECTETSLKTAFENIKNSYNTTEIKENRDTGVNVKVFYTKAGKINKLEKSMEDVEFILDECFKLKKIPAANSKIISEILADTKEHPSRYDNYPHAISKLLQLARRLDQGQSVADTTLEDATRFVYSSMKDLGEIFKIKCADRDYSDKNNLTIEKLLSLLKKREKVIKKILKQMKIDGNYLLPEMICINKSYQNKEVTLQNGQIWGTGDSASYDVKYALDPKAQRISKAHFAISIDIGNDRPVRLNYFVTDLNSNSKAKISSVVKNEKIEVEVSNGISFKKGVRVFSDETLNSSILEDGDTLIIGNQTFICSYVRNIKK